MKYRVLSRILSASTVGVGFAMYLHHFEVRQKAISKEVFLAQQAKAFDALQAHQVSIPYQTIFLYLATLLLIYELLAFCIYKLIRPQ